MHKLKTLASTHLLPSAMTEDRVARQVQLLKLFIPQGLIFFPQGLYGPVL